MLFKKGGSVGIVQLDGKDVYLSNFNHQQDELGYNIRTSNFGINYKRFKATLDFSLELIKLKSIFCDVYGYDGFSFDNFGKNYSRHVCSVTFKYSVKEYNRVAWNTYVRYDVKLTDAVFKDCIWEQDGELLGVIVENAVDTPVSPELLGKLFVFEDGVYRSTERFKTVMNASEIRQYVYKNGFYIDGIKMVRYKRSAGAARLGKCLFIDERLYPAIHEWELCGLTLEEGDDCDLAGLETYISLTASSIIGAINIEPENILLVDDYDSTFKDNVISIYKNGEHLAAKECVEEVTNCIWDGESLIDTSLMQEFSEHGFILLRNQFFKSAAFNCNLQQFFKDHNITSVDQLNGYTLAKDISQVLYVITPSSLKYTKYSTFNNWVQHSDSLYGVVKYEKKSKYLDGLGVKVSYQLCNTIGMTEEEVKEFMQPSIEYLNLIKDDITAFKHHINFLAHEEEEDPNVNSRNDIIYLMLGLNDKFEKTKMFESFKKDTIKSFVNELKTGRIIVNGNYSTMAGNISEFLLHTIGKFTGESVLGVGNIHSKRFAYNQELLCSRSPHTSSGNVLIANNVEDEFIDKYFNFTEEIVCINSIKENIMQRLSGCDFDSDSLLMTDNEVLLRCAKRHYDKFKVPTCDISSKKKKRRYESDDKADLDIFCDSDAIGIIVNLSQKINSLVWNEVNKTGNWDKAIEMYYDSALLSVLSGIAIDQTKREFDIDCMEELAIIKKKYELRDKNEKLILPKFFETVARNKGYYDPIKKKYDYLATPMDFIYSFVSSSHRRGRGQAKTYLTLSDIVSDSYLDETEDEVVANLAISLVESMDDKQKRIWLIKDDSFSNYDKKLMYEKELRDTSASIEGLGMNHATMKLVLKKISEHGNNSVSRKMMKILYGFDLERPNRIFMDLVYSSKSDVFELEKLDKEECYLADVFIYDTPYMKVPV